jgi:carbon-monoxide dehydrogenase large subunit
MPGVHAVNTAADLGATSVLSVNTVMPMLRALPFPVLARETLECVGQPVAVALAATPALAQSAVEAIDLDYDDLPMPEPERIAQKVLADSGDTARAFAEAATIAEVEIRHPRLAPSPMEPRAIAIRYDAKTDSATIYQSTQTPHRSRSEFAKILQVDPDRLRVIAPAVGGAFGMKGSVYPEEVFAVWAALHHRRDVKWTASRSEDFLSATHGRALVTRGRLALERRGAVHRAGGAGDGAGRSLAAELRRWSRRITRRASCPRPMTFQMSRCRTEVESHALPPVGIYRGAGRPEANTLIERLIDEAARRTGRDPLALRRRQPAAARCHAAPDAHGRRAGFRRLSRRCWRPLRGLTRASAPNATPCAGRGGSRAWALPSASSRPARVGKARA